MKLCRALSLLFLILTTEVRAEGLTLGFREFPQDINWLESTHPVALFVRRGITDALIVRTAKSEGTQFRLRVADSVVVSGNRLVWSFRVREGTTFHSGEPVTSEDIVYSLERCRTSGILPRVRSLKAWRKELVPEKPENWVDVAIDKVENSESSTSDHGTIGPFPLSLADCPIIERKSAQLFGSDLGLGSNLVSLGPYRMSDFDLGREVDLKRERSVRGETGAAEELGLRGFREGAHALTALRTGTIDAIIDAEPEIIEKARKDETLLISKCSIYMVIQRKGLRLQCDPKVDLTDIHYLN